MPDEGGPFSPADGGLRVRVRLTPKASVNRVTGVQETAEGAVALKVQVTAVPEGGKANAALVKLLSKAWRVPKSAVSVISGATDRNKILFIEGDSEELALRINRWMEDAHG